MTPEQNLFDRLRDVGALTPTAPTEGSPEEEMVRRGEPDATTPVTLRNLFTNPATHPVVIDFALLRALGTEWYFWEPETVWDEVRENFSTQLSELCRQKVRALQVLHSSRGPWERWQIFEKVAHVLNGTLPDFRVMQPLALEELYAAVDMIDFVRHAAWSDEVKLYMAGSVLNEDVFYVPPPLDFLQLEVSQPHYKCLDCGNEEPALFHDGFCSNCTQRMSPLQGLTLQPMQELVNAGKGKSLEVRPRYDFADVARRWKEVAHLPFSEFKMNEESMEDVQVSKLLLARDYMNIRRKQLAEQLTNLKSWLGAA